MEMTQSIKLVGKPEDVIRDATLLQEFLEGLETAAGEIPDVGNHQEWPTYVDGLLEFQGASVTVSEKLGRTLSILLYAHGSLVTRKTLQDIVVEEGKKPNEALVRISRLRALLSKDMPRLEIESVGTGYRLKIVD
ncbi:hypothetical protein RAAC3_TM7C00001G0955 [Candidatus Saccharibacteria bacterium RAAC3_TM7_1]|nr:hypothetical protein RAAC3_TM7C00001G0955 [Candidatus Saccharibacteria bacterium RAAC3_TM7_1]